MHYILECFMSTASLEANALKNVTVNLTENC